MIGLSTFIITVIVVSVFVFYIIEKITLFKTRKMHRDLFNIESEAKRELSRYYRARTWDVIVRSKGDRDFTPEELDSIQAMGLGDLLKEEDYGQR